MSVCVCACECMGTVREADILDTDFPYFQGNVNSNSRSQPGERGMDLELG